MKKIFSALLLVFVSLISSSCAKTAISSDKPQIYTSFYAIYDFTKEIAGDKADVYNMVPSGTEPHDWEPTAQDMAKLNNADILFYNGLGMESWIDKVMSSLSGSNVKFDCISDNVPVKSENNDPHIWLDPQNAKIMCKNILDTLCEIDPDNKALYEANYNNYAVQLDSIDKTFTDSLEAVPENNRKIVVSHEAYSYLCDAYGLTQVPIEGISAEGEPSPDKMMELINYIKDNNIKYIFFEELVSPKTAQTLADETEAQLLPLNPFEGLTDEEISAGENYISVMSENLKNLKEALG
ncbi:MAG: metal ABC transporter substrate-binding protein [Clostridia bacterium]|nr:metal ABC transporter substrate-binding protein [Clostridia bacterium]